MIGIVSLNEALQASLDAGLDLVEISPQAEPPVCKILDYGKFKYEEQKKKNEARKKQRIIEIKEVKLRPGIDDHDYDVKMRSMVRFLDEGDKVKVTMRFRGREMAHQEFGLRLIERVKNDLEPYAVIEQYPKMEGRQMVMVLSPKQKPVKPAAAPAAKKPAAAKPAAAPEAAAAQPAAAAPVVEEKK